MYHPIQTLRAAARRGRNAFTALPPPARVLADGLARQTEKLDQPKGN